MCQASLQNAVQTPQMTCIAQVKTHLYRTQKGIALDADNGDNVPQREV